MFLMSKTLPIRYFSEEEVKRALRIDSFRNLSKKKIMKFASMIPYMDKEVAKSIINQFPVFADFGRIAIADYMKICDNILEKNSDSMLFVIQGYQTILTSLSKRMEVEEVSEDERQSITDDMIKVADRIKEADLENKRFLERNFEKAGLFLLGMVAIIGGAIGLKSQFGNGGKLPQVEDDDYEEIDEEDDS